MNMRNVAHGSADGPRYIYGKENVNWAGPKRAAANNTFGNPKHDAVHNDNKIVYADDIVDMEEMNNLITQKLVTKKDHKEYPYSIYCYSKQAEYHNAWDNDTLRQARGLIIDNHTGEVIARPYEKFFNLNQPKFGMMTINPDIDVDARIRSYDKMDGSLMISYLTPDGDIRWATKGSFYSDHANFANNLYQKDPLLSDVRESTTYLAEFVGPSNVIVLKYPEDDLVLLGGRDIATGEEYFPEDLDEWEGNIAERQEHSSLREAMNNWNSREDVEGQVVTFTSGQFAGQKTKLKTDNYFALHRAVFNMTNKTIFDLMYDRGMKQPKSIEDVNEYIADLPDEFQGDAKKIRDNILNLYNNKMDEIVALGETVPNFENKKDLVVYLKEHHPDRFHDIIGAKDGGRENSRIAHSVWMRIFDEIRSRDNTLKSEE